MPRILIVAGSDSGGGAGIQGDIKTVTALGGYAATAITALTAQDTRGVSGVHEVPPPFIATQMEMVLADIGADAVKTGMLHSAGVIRAVARTLQPHPSIPLIVDPVMVAKGGAALLQEEALVALKSELIPLAAVITPNTPEASALLGATKPIATVEEMRQAAAGLLALGPRAVLVKGGHVESGDTIHNVLATADGMRVLSMPRIASRHTHGTGCTLASAIATYLAQGRELAECVERAQRFVHEAIIHAPGLGHGHGPLGHWAAGRAVESV